jgi:hypothetical protein
MIINDVIDVMAIVAIMIGLMIFTVQIAKIKGTR